MTYNLSELFELVADAVPDRVAVAMPGRRVTYAQLDERANRLAHHLAAAGVGAGSHVGLHMVNGVEYLEAMLASYKLRAVPVNVNYRYVERELEYLYSYMDLVALVVHRQFVAAAATVAGRTPLLGHVVVVDDSSGAPLPQGWQAYEEALAGASPARDFECRSSDDVYCACTGGTTGLPKGVMWRHEDIFFAALTGGDPTRMLGPISRPEQLRERITDPIVMLLLPPLMHVAALWGAFGMLLAGGTVVMVDPGPLDAAAAWRAIEAERVNIITLVGNVMARPLIEHYAEHPCDASSLFAMASGGAILSASTKARIHELLPNVFVLDGFGSTETGFAGTDMTTGEGRARETPVFQMDETTTVLDDTLEALTPGDGRSGHLARRGRMPLGYYKDPEKTAATFVEKNGVRWVLPGDIASIDPDGSIVLHGRGSVSINTGGEKVFPEEVEASLVSHPAVEDVVVVGVADPEWGQRVVAVLQTKPGKILDLDALQRFAREHLAGYKIPRSLVTVDHVVRSPSGKPDYTWAAGLATERLDASRTARS